MHELQMNYPSIWQKENKVCCREDAHPLTNTHVHEVREQQYAMTVEVKGCLRACLLPDPEGAGKGVTLHTPLRTKGTVDLGGYRLLPQLARRPNDTKAEQTMTGLSEKRRGVKSFTYCPPV